MYYKSNIVLFNWIAVSCIYVSGRLSIRHISITHNNVLYANFEFMKFDLIKICRQKGSLNMLPQILINGAKTNLNNTLYKNIHVYLLLML